MLNEVVPTDLAPYLAQYIPTSFLMEHALLDHQLQKKKGLRVESSVGEKNQTLFDRNYSLCWMIRH
jgi:hypothetical protein